MQTQPQRPDLSLARMRVVNFRSLEDVTIWFDDSTSVLIGGNNTGKTAILQALGIGLGQPANEDDLRRNQDGSFAGDTVIVVEFSVAPDASQEFESVYLNQRTSDDQLIVRTQISLSSDADRILIERDFLTVWPDETDSPVTTRANTARFILRRFRRFVRWTYLDAQRDLAAQVGKLRSRFGRLLSELQLSEADRDSIETQLSAASAGLLDGSATLREVRAQLRKGVTAVNLDAQQLTLEPIPADLEQIARAAEVMLAAPGGPRLPISRHGMGTRSLSDLLLVQAMIALEQGNGGEPDGARPLFVTAFEEPEAHLHPSAVRAVAELIRAMPGQKVVSTHAPGFVQTAPMESMTIVCRPSTSSQVRSLAALKGDFYQENSKEIERTRREVFLAKPDIPFSRLVVLFEGATERTALPVLYDFVAGTTDGGATHGVLWVDMGGAGGLTRFARACCFFGVPWLALLDGDRAGTTACRTWLKQPHVETARRESVAASDLRLHLLPAGHCFDSYVIDSGFKPAVVAALREMNKTATDEDESTGIEGLSVDVEAERTSNDILLSRLKNIKGAFGRFLADAMVHEIEYNGAMMPLGLTKLFQSIERYVTSDVPGGPP